MLIKIRTFLLWSQLSSKPESRSKIEGQGDGGQKLSFCEVELLGLCFSNDENQV